MGTEMKKVTATILAISFLLGTMGTVAEAKPGKRADYSKEQQARFYADAIKACRKKYGPAVERAQVDYLRRRYVCWTR
jgi:hypothetical protein